MINKEYVPKIPFDSYKWFWACKTPTEALNDPAVLLGVLRIIALLGGCGYRYSGSQFADQLVRLSEDIPKTTVDLARRTGSRNLMRNSRQYWSALGLIPLDAHGGEIMISKYGAQVADGQIDQGDFAALTIATFTLPNKATYSEEEIEKWHACDLSIHPLRLILAVMRQLNDLNEGWLTANEIAKILVPMAGDKQSASTIAEYICFYRKKPLLFDSWPICTSRDNDMRFIREFLLFLYNYGYVTTKSSLATLQNRFDERYYYMPELDVVVEALISGRDETLSAFGNAKVLKMIRQADVASTVTTVVGSRRTQRPGQARFRQRLLELIGRCPITNVDLPDVLEAAHIKPNAYGGPENEDNGWPMRVDIHRLFDAGKLRIRPQDDWGIIEFTDEQTERNYFSLKAHGFQFPKQTNLEYVRWRYENYTVGMRVND